MSDSTERPLFRTPVEVGRPLRHVGVGDRSVFLGSCFAEHVGRHFTSAKLLALVNPLGVIYNPLSLARLLTTTESLQKRDYISNKGMWHSWLGDSSLSRLSEEECRRATDDALRQLHDALEVADNLFLTFGTDHYYCFTGEHADTKETAELPVANCHRLLSRCFIERVATVEEMTEALDAALIALRERNPNLQVIVTVSPYRYQKYGFHESQLSKARLLLCADELVARHPEWVCYFAAYELVLDELRDYRFYAEDMLHPSAQAVDYVWRRLCEVWMDDSVREYLRRWEPLRQALEHRPLHPESPEYIAFQQRTHEQLAQLQRDYPMMRGDISQESRVKSREKRVESQESRVERREREKYIRLAE